MTIGCDDGAMMSQKALVAAVVGVARDLVGLTIGLLVAAVRTEAHQSHSTARHRGIDPEAGTTRLSTVDKTGRMQGRSVVACDVAAAAAVVEHLRALIASCCRSRFQQPYY